MRTVKQHLRGIVMLTIPLFFNSTLRAQSANAASNSQALRILSYNMHHANPPSQADSIDLKAIIQVIKSTHADLVALQEVDANTRRSGTGNQAIEIAKALGMYSYFAKAIDFQGGAYGLAILSKYPIQNPRVYPLPSNPETGGEPRILAVVTLTLPNQQHIRFANTHLDAQKEDTNRILQIQAIKEITQKLSEPLILAGDFNAVENSEVIHVLDKDFTRTCSSCPPTIPVINPLKAIDFIAFKPAPFFKIQQHQVLRETYASDHLPVLAVLAY